jgi:pyruvate-formate lyase-activating enzyme
LNLLKAAVKNLDLLFFDNKMWGERAYNTSSFGKSKHVKTNLVIILDAAIT